MRRVLITLAVLISSPVWALPTWVENLPLWQWYQIPNTNLSSVEPAPPHLVGVPSSKITSWCGAALKESGSVYILGAAGGHADYHGNEVDAITLNTETPQWVQLRARTADQYVIDASQFYLDDRPSATHTYYATQFVNARNRMFVMPSPGMGAPSELPACSGSYCGDQGYTFSFNVGTGDWDAPTYVPQYGGTSGDFTAALVAKHPVTEDIYYNRYPSGWWRWNQSSNTWQKLNNNNSPQGNYAGAAIDPTRNRMLVVGSFGAVAAPHVLDLSGNQIAANFGGLGSSSLTISGYPGVIYDQVNDNFLVIHNSGGSVRIRRVHPVTWFVDDPATSGAAPAARQNGIHNAAQYVPELGGIVIANTYGGNVYFIRTSGTPANPACSDGFDNDNDGLTDTADPGCENGSDTSEHNAAVECDDGLDNDGDGDIDRADAGCPNLTDTDETDCGDNVCEGGEFAGGPGVQGLDFPLSGGLGTNHIMRFKFTNPHTTGLPIYGTGGAGVTYIWRAYPRQQAGYYTAFFWGNDDGQNNLNTFGWFGGAGNTYYGAHPYPQPPPGGSSHKWEVSAAGQDLLSSQNVEYDRWHTQVLRVWGASGAQKHHEFYWDWPDQTRLVTYTSDVSYANVNPPAPALTWGDAPWNPGGERWYGILRGIQVYSSLLSLTDIAAEVATPRSSTAGDASIWYLNLNPTPTDISDDSGLGHDPAWVGTLRPNLYDTSNPDSCDADCAADPNALDVATCAFDYPTPYSIGYTCSLNQTLGSDSDYDTDSALAIRYRKASVGTWTTGHPGQLVLGDDSIANGASTPGQYMTNQVYLRRGTHYAGVVWDLEPGTSYFIEFTFSDPDGGGEVQTLQTATRAELVTDPATPNYPCPDGNTSDTVDDGAADNCDTVAEIQAAVAAATAGSIIRIAPGTYAPTSGAALIDVTGKAGTESSPIVVRCVDQATTILDDGSTNYAFLSNGTSFVYVEDCTLTGDQAFSYTIRLNQNGERIVFRRNLIRTASTCPGVGDCGAVGGKQGNKYGFHFEDNRVQGTFLQSSIASRGTAAEEGILLWGQGHVIMHNTCEGTGDCLGTSYADSGSTTTIQTRNWYVEGNDVRWNKDDCFEFDYNFGNMVILRNRCTNAQDCFSTQTGYGGPFYFLRNICWIGGRADALKFKVGTDFLGDPDGLWVYNNLISIPWFNYMGGGRLFELHVRNNLWVGAAGESLISDHGENYYGRFRRSGAHPCPEVTDNAYSYNGGIEWQGCGAGNVATVAAAGVVEIGSFIATEPIFADRSGWTPPNTYPDDDDGGTVFHAIPDPRLHASSNVIDQGAVIPNVTDGYAGAGPDIGPYEIGAPLVEYGVRAGAAPDPACSDGLDNDGDGNTDYPADGGCTSAADTSERGAPEQCDDGSDNDGDTLADYPADPQCTGPTDDDETAGVVFECSDGLDNDSDGTIDCADPACGSPCDGTLDTEVGATACDDDVDNDFDGATDCADGACLSGVVCQPARTSEVNCGDARCSFGSGETIANCSADCRECNDGLDNDGDGLADHPNDAGCTGTTDSDETNCGDGVCEGTEDPTGCPADCAAPPSSPATLRGAELRGGSR